MRIAVFAILLLALQALPAEAQFFDWWQPPPQEQPRQRIERPAPARPPPPKPAPDVATLPDPPYQSRLDRLSEILGALHYLRPLCIPAEKTVWRDEMQQMLDAENPEQARRARMVAAFNHSYSGFHETYRRCTAAARIAGDRYRDEGMRLTRDLTSRFTD